MLEQSIVHMTESEIDAYYSRQREENLKRYYALKAKRSIRESRGRLIRMAFLTIVALIVCTVFLKLDFRVQQQIYRVAILEKELAELRLTNADAKKRLDDAKDLHIVQERAAMLGMGYPKKENVVYYSVGDCDYMFQTDEIPQS